MLYNLCYVSSAKSNLTKIDLDHLFRVNKRNNTTLDISGLLVYNNGNFLQILEGEEKRIRTLFAKISTDDRHSNIIELINMSVEERIFDDYESGFVIVEDHKKLDQLKSYLNWVKEAELLSVDKVIHIVENFIGKK